MARRTRTTALLSALLVALVSACGAPLSLPTSLHIDDVTPAFGRVGTTVTVTGRFTSDVDIEVCGVELEGTSFSGDDRAVIAPGITGAGPTLTSVSGVIGDVPAGRACDVRIVRNGTVLTTAREAFTTEPSGNVVVTALTRIDVLDVSADGYQVIASATLPGELGDTHTIFGATWHPTEPWLYVTSINQWRDARIDAFDWNGSDLTHLSTLVMSDTDVNCGADCATTGLVFSVDGAYLYVNEDSDDFILTFAVNPSTSELSLVEQGAAQVWLQGLTRHPTEPYLYNGVNVVTLADGIPLAGTATGSLAGNSAYVVTTGRGHRLISDLDNASVTIADLTDPAAPSRLDTLTDDYFTTRFLSVDSATERLVAVGDNLVRVLSFADDILTVVAEYALDEPLDAAAGQTMILRHTYWIPGTDLIVASWFAGGSYGVWDSGVRPGGQLVFSVDGSDLTLRYDIEAVGMARPVLGLP